LDIGPYSEEGNTIDKIHKLIKESEGNFEGFKQKHHEIYLNYPRKKISIKK